MSTKTVKHKTGYDITIKTNKVIDLFVVAILCIFPLITTNRYYNILPTKYYFYIASTFLLVIALAFVILIEKGKTGTFSTAFNWKKVIGEASITDYALIAFLAIALVSTLLSDYKYEAFWGNEGRYSGLFLLCLYGAAYFGVTKFGKLKKWYLDAFLVVSMFVCIWGITDYFQMDIFKFKVRMMKEQIDMFTSSVGNINTYTALVGMIIAVTAVLYTTEKKVKRAVFYYICLVIGFFAIIMGLSDNAYLSIAALFGFLPLYLFGSKLGVKRYLITVATFFTVAQCIDWINLGMAGKVPEIDGVFNLIVGYQGLLFVVLGLWIFVGLFYAIDFVLKDKIVVTGNWLRILWLVFLTVMIGGLGFAFYDANINANAGRYGGLGSYLIFNDEWGTHRGYIWRNAMECYKEFSPLKKAIGFGPDTFGILLRDKTRGNIYGETFDNAHNEYLHYLITVGLVGLTAYLTYLTSFIIRCVKNGLDNPHVVACLMAVICYAVQAIVNLNLPIATPIMWMLLMLGMMGCKGEKIRKI